MARRRGNFPVNVGAFLKGKTSKRSVGISALVEEYLEWLGQRGSRSIDTVRSALRRADEDLRPFATEAIAGLEQDHVVAWIEALKADTEGDFAPLTVHKFHAQLKQLLAYAVRTGAAERNVAERLPAGTLPPRRSLNRKRARLEVLEPAQVRRLISDHRLAFGRRLLWAIVLLTGMRIGEASGLRWRDLDRTASPLPCLKLVEQWSTRRRRFDRLKEEEPRELPVHPELELALWQAPFWFARAFGRFPTGDDLICPFVDSRLNKPQPTPWNSRTALKAWHEDLVTVQIPLYPTSAKRREHAARHTFRYLLELGDANDLAARALMHALDTSDPHLLYVHLTWEAFCRAVLRITLPPLTDYAQLPLFPEAV